MGVRGRCLVISTARNRISLNAIVKNLLHIAVYSLLKDSKKTTSCLTGCQKTKENDMTIKVMLIDLLGHSFIDIENDNKAFDNALGWDDCWNTPAIYVNGQHYICVCSDRGKIRHEKISCLSIRNLYEPSETIQEPFIVGNVIITKFNGTDDFTSLNDKDIENLEQHILNVGAHKKDFMREILILD